jgi:hypothetical protein
MGQIDIFKKIWFRLFEEYGKKKRNQMYMAIHGNISIKASIVRRGLLEIILLMEEVN